MARPYSNDLRARVAALRDGGYTCREVAELLQMGVATVVRIGQRHRETGNADSKPMGGARHNALGEHRAWLRQRIKQTPDLTLEALRAELSSKHNLKVGLSPNSRRYSAKQKREQSTMRVNRSAGY